MRVLRAPLLLYQRIRHKHVAQQGVDFRFLSTIPGQDNNTVNNLEIKLFSKQTEEWWDANGQLKPLHSMNTVRVPFIRDGLVQTTNSERNSTPLKDLKILDVGCGGGILSEALARIGATVTGIDACEDLIGVAKEHSSNNPKIANNQPTYHMETIEDHVTTHVNYYDAIVASEVIEHVNNPEFFVKSCAQAVKPGGKLFFTTPNRTRTSQFLSIIMAEYVLRLVRKGTHQYEKFITPNELTFMLERNNCHVETINGFIYNPVNNRWHVTSMTELIYAIQAVKLNA